MIDVCTVWLSRRFGDSATIISDSSGTGKTVRSVQIGFVSLVTRLEVDLRDLKFAVAEELVCIMHV
jgi:hypothetical protein